MACVINLKIRCETEDMKFIVYLLVLTINQPSLNTQNSDRITNIQEPIYAQHALCIDAGCRGLVEVASVPMTSLPRIGRHERKAFFTPGCRH
jgi:hypothetical protein